MPFPLDTLAKQISPENTILLFGSGATIPSGAPSVSEIMGDLSAQLGEPVSSYTFSEYCSLFEIRKSRRELVSIVRNRIRNLRPTGGLLNLPNSPWRSIFTTNYDDLIEKCYLRKNKEVKVFASNFDFDGSTPPNATPVLKLHGTIGLDVVDGSNSRMILTAEDNDIVEEYREKLYDRLKGDLSDSDLVIIGHSLADPDIGAIVKRAVRVKRECHSSKNIYVLSYTTDHNRALLLESLGVRCVFGGIDEFFLALADRGSQPPSIDEENFLSAYERLTPTTIDVAHETKKSSANFDAMYSGSPCNYPEIRAGFSFERSARNTLKSKLLSESQFITILGASGVGKTTLARQIALSLVDDGFLGWEHQSNRPFFSQDWRSVAMKLKEEDREGVLVLDDAHLYLPEVNDLVNSLVADENSFLRLIVTSSNNHWKPRVKSSNLARFGHTERLSRLDDLEISSLLNLVQNQANISRLVDHSFRGFTYQERKRRLMERCNSDFFVCLKNIFANERFDFIVLREFASIPSDFQDIYKHICALESLGVIIHRQLVIRMLSISAQDLPVVLDNLDGLVEEYTLDRRNSVYGWRGRHPVISNIVTEYKFSDPDEIFSLIRRVVSTLSPSYDVEIATMRQLCSSDMGIRRISDVGDQNELLRIMISTAPSERVPRHRLISNLIRQGAFSDAETEIRVFEHDLKLDGPTRRYKIRLKLERAIGTPGIMPEDKAKLLNDAHDAVVGLVERTPNLPHNLRLFGDVCLEIYKVTGDYAYVEAVRRVMRSAETETSDPEVTQALMAFEQRLTRSVKVSSEFAVVEAEEIEDFVDLE